MSSLASTSRNISKRSLTFNKSFVISVTIHILIIFGVSITTYYKIPLLKEAPIINVKLANSNQDLMTNFMDGKPQNSKKNLASFATFFMNCYPVGANLEVMYLIQCFFFSQWKRKSFTWNFSKICAWKVQPLCENIFKTARET